MLVPEEATKLTIAAVLLIGYTGDSLLKGVKKRSNTRFFYLYLNII